MPISWLDTNGKQKDIGHLHDTNTRAAVHEWPTFTDEWFLWLMSWCAVDNTDRLKSLQLLILTSSTFSVTLRQSLKVYSVQYKKNVKVKAHMRKALWVLKSKTDVMEMDVAAPCSKCLIWVFVPQVAGENRQKKGQEESQCMKCMKRKWSVSPEHSCKGESSLFGLQ